MNVCKPSSWEDYARKLSKADIVVFNNPDVGYKVNDPGSRRRNRKNDQLVEWLSDFANAMLKENCLLCVSKSKIWATRAGLNTKEEYKDEGLFLNHPLGVDYATELTTSGGRSGKISANLNNSNMYCYKMKRTDRGEWNDKRQWRAQESW